MLLEAKHRVLFPIALAVHFAFLVGCDDGGSTPDDDAGTDADTDTDSDSDCSGVAGDATHLGPFGGAMTRPIEDPTSPGRLFSIASSTYSTAVLYTSIDDGATWTEVDVPTDFSVTALLFLEDGRLVVGTDLEIFVTDDLEEWTDIRGNIEEGSMYGVTVRGLAYEPGAPGRLWAALGGMYSQAPIWTLTDGEEDWVPWNAPADWGADPLNGAAHFTDLAVAYDEGTLQTIVFASYEEDFAAGGGVFCSTDSGDSFALCSSGLPNAPFHRVRVDDGIAVAAGGHVFGDAFAGVYYSTNGGADWIESTVSLQDAIANDITRLPGGDYLAATYGAGLWRTAALDTAWTEAAGFEEMTVNSVAALSSGDLLASPEQLGFFRSANDGQTWQASSQGLLELEASFAAIDPANPDAALIAVSSENSGLCLFTQDGIDGWAPVTAMPHPRYTFVDIAPSGRWYAVSDGPTTQANDGIWVSDDDGASFDFIGPLDGANMDHSDIRVVELGDPSRLVAAGSYWMGPPDAFIMTTEDFGASWTTLWEGTAGEESGYALADFAILPDGGFLVALGGAPLVRVSSSGEATVVPIDAPAQTDVIDLAACAFDAETWYAIGLDAAWETTALVTRDAGATWSVLPLTGFEDESPMAVEAHPLDCDLVFLSTNAGAVRATGDGGATWTEIAPNASVFASGMRVVDLEDQPESALLFWGRGGLVRVDLSCEP